MTFHDQKCNKNNIYFRGMMKFQRLQIEFYHQHNYLLMYDFKYRLLLYKHILMMHSSWSTINIYDMISTAMLANR